MVTSAVGVYVVLWLRCSQGSQVEFRGEKLSRRSWVVLVQIKVFQGSISREGRVTILKLSSSQLVNTIIPIVVIG